MTGLAGVFSSPQLGSLAEAYVRHLVGSLHRSYSTCANYVCSLVNLARFVLTVRQRRAEAGVVVSPAPVDQLTALHRQCMQQARHDDLFKRASGGDMVAWLDWPSVQRGRVAAVEAYSQEDHEETKLVRARDALLTTLFATMPPDRVAVVRSNAAISCTAPCLHLVTVLVCALVTAPLLLPRTALRLGGTLKRTPSGFDLDLSQPDAHKTSASALRIEPGALLELSAAFCHEGRMVV